MHVFFADDISHDVVHLSTKESYHCAKVLRFRAGEEVMITDGRGLMCRAIVEESHPGNSTFRITKRSEGHMKRPFHLHMAVAPTKKIDRFEWFLEKATECGIDEISPIYGDYSERRFLKPQRFEKIMVSAMKQSARAFLPKLNPLAKLSTFLRQPKPPHAFIAHCGEGEKHSLLDIYSAGRDVLLVIGPEGDFSEEELEAAASNGFKAISMGPHRLRTETAALALCVQVNTMNGLL